MTERLFLRLDGDAVHGPETSAPAGTMRAFAVAPALRGHVAQILCYREDFAPGMEVLERVVPDGAVRLVFNLGEPPRVGTAPGQAVEAIGAATSAAMVRLRGRTAGLSLTLRPGAAAALLGQPASEITGTAVHLDALWRGAAAGLLAQMAEAPGDAARVALLQAALQRRLRAHGRPEQPRLVAHAARLITTAGGQRPLREVADAVGVGERRLQQLFNTHLGLAPRAWSRLARLHECLRALRAWPVPAWAELALDTGFFDQPHLVNEFRALCGVTPTQYLGRLHGQPAPAISVSSKTPA